MGLTTNQKMQKLAQLQDYWAVRASVQLRYMEQLVQSGILKEDTLWQNAVEQLYDIYCREGNLCKNTVLVWEKACLEPVRTIAKSLRVNCIGHAHIDMNWQWGYEETVMVTLDTFRTMLQLMQEYPEMIFLQSQASVYQIVEKYASQMLEEIRAAIRRGQWEVVATTWVEEDKNMTGEESTARHLLYTRKYLKELLQLTDEDFLINFEPDTFGHPAQTPAILASGGVKYLYHCRGEEKLSLYRWQAPSGQSVTVLREPQWYNAPIEWTAFLHIPSYCTQHGLDRMCYVFGMGDHGGGVTRRDLERLRDMATWPCMAQIGFGKLRDFFAYIEQMPLPVVTGERNFVFDGCYTTQTRIKKGNRLSEQALYRAETMSTLATIHDVAYEQTAPIEEAWKKVLFNHFHDIIPGSGVIATREYAMGLYQEAMAGAGVLSSNVLRALSKQIDTMQMLPAEEVLNTSVSEGAGVGYGTTIGHFTGANGFAGGRNRLYNVFNTTQFAWNGLAELTIWDWALTPDRIEIRDEEGNVLPHIVIDAVPRHYWAHFYFRVLVKCQIPAFGYRTLLATENNCAPAVPYMPDPRLDRPVDHLILENDCIRVEFDQVDLRICSVKDVITGEEYIRDGETGGLDYILEDDSKGMTSWRVGRHMSRIPAVTNVHSNGVQQNALRSSLSFSGEINHSKVNVNMWLDQGSRMLCMDVHCKWLETGEPGCGIPQLAFRLPLKNACQEFLNDAPFMVEKHQPHPYDIPALSFVYASGIMLTTSCKYGFRCTEDAVSATLIRSAFDPDEIPEVYVHDFQIGVGIPASGTVEELLCESVTFAHKPLSVAAMPHAGKLPVKGTLAQISGNAKVETLKMAEDGSGDVILRVVSLEETSKIVRVLLPGGAKAAYLVDVHEQNTKEIPVEQDGSVAVNVGAHEICSLRICC